MVRKTCPVPCVVQAFLLIGILFVPSIATAGNASDLANQARRLGQNGDYAQAIEIGMQALEQAKKEQGTNKPLVAYIQNELATFFVRTSQITKALEYGTAAVELGERLLDADSVNLAALHANYAGILSRAGDYHRAESYYLKALDTYKSHLSSHGGEAADAAQNLATSYMELSRPDKAEHYLDFAIELERKKPKPSREAMLRSFRQRAEVALARGDSANVRKNVAQAERYLPAEEPARSKEQALLELVVARSEVDSSQLRAAQTRLEKNLQRLTSSNLSDSLMAMRIRYELGNLFLLRGQAVEAETLFKKSLDGFRKHVGAKHPAVGRCMHSLGRVYRNLGQEDLAEQYFNAAIDLFAQSLGEKSAPVAASKLELAAFLGDEARSVEGEKLAQEALAIFASLDGDWRLKKGYAHSAAGFAQFAANRLDAAKESFLKATGLIAQVRGESSSDLPPGYMKLAQIYLSNNEYSKARKYLKKAVAIQRKDNATGPRGLPQSLMLFAQLEYQAGKKDKALKFAKEAVDILSQRLTVAQSSRHQYSLGEQKKWRSVYENYLQIAYSEDLSGEEKVELKNTFFKVAQYPHLTDTAAAIERMVASFIPDDPALGALVRDRQEMIEKWQDKRDELESLLKLAKSNPEAINVLRTAVKKYEEKLDSMDAVLRETQAYARYVHLTNPKPVAWSDIGAVLDADEGLLLQVTDPEATYLLLVTRQGVEVARSAMTRVELGKRVESLRQSLDLTRRVRPKFNRQHAYALFRDVFQPFADAIGDFRDFDSQRLKHIFFVPDGAMQNLPPSLLVTKPPQPQARYGELDFLAKYTAISVLPSVSALRSLRTGKRSPSHRKPLIGFAAPDFAGTANNGSRGLVKNVVEQMKNQVEPARLRELLIPLPESEDEVKSIASMLNANNQDLFFGAEASEATVKRAKLSDFQYIAFATHGLMSGEFEGVIEPSLALTPPSQATELDDGLLMASEVAELKLDADWVLLSACNTASPSQDHQGAEGLSGLARSFFYAGAKSLLVSHWWVSSLATTELTTSTIEHLTGTPGLGRAEALRRAMVDMLSKNKYSNPVLWAPFVVVGEGGALR